MEPIPPADPRPSVLRRPIELFRIAGVPVRADLSWLLLAALVTWWLGGEVFPTAYPQLAAATAWAMGLGATVGLFASLLLHEVAHLLVARHYRIPIRGITLFIFGGVTDLADEPPSAEAELMTAAAGPAASGWLAGALGLAWLEGAVSGRPEPWTALLGFLAAANAVLFAFNLVPAFPLDGGRMLRSALWLLRGDLPWASRFTSGLGSLFGAFLIALGVVAALSGQLLAGVWWLLVGFLLRGAARASHQHLALRRSLAGERVERLMQGDPVSVPRAISVEELVEQYVQRHRLNLFPVVDDDRLVGLVTTQALARLPREEWSRQSVGAVAERCGPDNTVTPGSDALEAFRLMSRGGLSRLLVAEGDRLVGVLSLADLVQFSSLKQELGDAGG